MRALAGGAEPRRVGCTQFTDILDFDGMRLVGVLPRPFGLATTRVAAVTTRAADAALAQRLVALLAPTRRARPAQPSASSSADQRSAASRSASAPSQSPASLNGWLVCPARPRT